MGHKWIVCAVLDICILGNSEGVTSGPKCSSSVDRDSEVERLRGGRARERHGGTDREREGEREGV